MKRTISILLILLLILPFMPLNKAYGTDFFPKGNTTYDGNVNMSFEDIQYALPAGTPKVDNKYGFPLNIELFLDKGILVYGSYSSVTKNDFKAHSKFSTLDPNGNPYYTQNGVKGEYRYHGFDQVGNRYGNDNFPRDYELGLELQEKSWIFQPWERIGDRAKLVDISPYNQSATLDNHTKTQAWINETAGFMKNADNTWIKPDPYNYIHILSPPTARSGGEGMMWHNFQGKRYYQTFSVPVLKHEHKEMTPVQAKVTILSTPEELTFREDQKEIAVRVQVQGTLQDQAYFGKEPEQTMYYTRRDILEWEISLAGMPAQKVQAVGNMGTAEFTVKVERNHIINNPEITFIGTAKALFLTEHSSGTATASATVNFGEITGKGFMSYFTINRTIIVNHWNQIKSELVNYRDASIGDIVKYDYRIENTLNGQFTTFTFNAPSVYDNEVNAKIRDFIKTFTDGKTEGLFHFQVRQTVTNGANEIDIHEEILEVRIIKVETIKMPQINPNMPDLWFDIVPYPVNDGSTDIGTRSVYVDGVQVNENQFFSGNYIFGESDIDRLVKIEIKYNTLVDFGTSAGNYPGKIEGVHNIEGEFVKWVSVYSTKPRAYFKLEGTNKQNRKMSVTDNSSIVNAEFVISHYPISNYQWRYRAKEGEGNLESLRLKEISSLKKEFLYKEPGIYEIELVVTNTLGRQSDPYILSFAVFEDYQPAVILNLWNNTLARNEEISMYHDVVSTDGDIISKNIIEIYYDHDNNGEATEHVGTYSATEFENYTPTKLGTYKVINIVEEDFGEETIPEFITEEDKVRRVTEREFFVDNFRPLTEMYIDIPMVLPEIDVYFMLDQHLDRDKNDYVVSNRMNINNYLRTKNIRPKVENWDMHTYVYTQPASTSVFSGTSYPSTTTSYSSGGYSGTLNRYSVSDNGYNHDFGSYHSKTESRTFTDSWTNTVSSWGTWTPYTTNTSQSSPAPSSISINSDGYVGSIPRTSTTGSMSSQSPPKSETNNDWSSSGTFTAYYSGTLTKTVQYWVSDWRWVPQYTGYYSGTIYKYVRQPYSNPFRTLSDKYIIYISDNNISQLNDLTTVLSKADARVILIGQNNMKTQIPHEYFILNNKPMNELVNEALNYIAESNPYVQRYLVEAGVDTFEITTANYDDEGDPIIHQGFQYVQDQNYFDTPLGNENYAVTTYSDDTWVSTNPTLFNSTGKFEIYRRIQDQPSSDPNFSSFSYISNIPMITVFSHRRPIALATLDWDYDASRNLYLTTWVDKSFDWDHINSRFDKGIVERKIRYRRNGGEWIYRIPDELPAGMYDLEYYVKDPENTWSDVFTLSFTLKEIPPMQFTAKARTLEEQFSMNSIPASEYLEVYDAWTRYPYQVHLEMAIYQGNTRLTPVKTVQYNPITGTKTGNDIYWNNVSYQIPETLPDGQYMLRVTAVGEGGQTASEYFPIRVVTPINLVITSLPEFIAETSINIVGSTTKYPHTVTAKLYYQTPHEENLEMASILITDYKEWDLLYEVPNHIEDGFYWGEFTARTPNGNEERLLMEYEFLTLRLENLRITTIADYNWQNYFLTENKSPKPLMRDGIAVKDMPIYLNRQHQGIKLGYRVYFKIDSIGLHEMEDTITLKASYYALDQRNRLFDADIYVQDDKGNYSKLENSPYYTRAGNTTLQNQHRYPYEKLPQKEKHNTWEFDMFIPSNAKVVPKGKPLDLIGDNTFNYLLLVVLEVTGVKGQGAEYDYTERETLWGTDNGSVYGQNRPTNLDLLEKGVNHGEVFFYRLDETLRDDFILDRNW